MGLETKLLQRMDLRMTPQLQQAIKLLQLGRPEYLEAIAQQVLENPVLEEMRDDPEPLGLPNREPEPHDPLIPFEGQAQNISFSDSSNDDATEATVRQEPSADWDDYVDTFTDFQGSASSKSSLDFEDRQPPEIVATHTQTLERHILEQIRMHDLSEAEKMIAIHIVGNLDADGFLACDLQEIADTAGFPLSDVEEIASIMKFLDPIGACTANLQECLLTQLEAMGLSERLEARMVRDHLDKLEKRRFDAIAKVEGVPLEEVARALQVIRSLEPRPGRKFADETVRYIVPDVYVHRIGKEYIVTLNDEGVPRLRISNKYSGLLKDSQHKNYLSEQVRAAQWLIRSIHQRQQTILKVTESIVKFQKDFLDRGVEGLKPLVLREVAEDIGMHESTVSRITTEKYVHTPQGVFELKFFFSSGIKTATGDVSSSSIKDKIKGLIAAENPAQPISDQQIVDILKAEKVDIARRTIAKYRETLGIESSAMRKRIL